MRVKQVDFVRQHTKSMTRPAQTNTRRTKKKQFPSSISCHNAHECARVRVSVPILWSSGQFVSRSSSRHQQHCGDLQANLQDVSVSVCVCVLNPNYQRLPFVRLHIFTRSSMTQGTAAAAAAVATADCYCSQNTYCELNLHMLVTTTSSPNTEQQTRPPHPTTNQTHNSTLTIKPRRWTSNG